VFKYLLKKLLALVRVERLYLAERVNSLQKNIHQFRVKLFMGRMFSRVILARHNAPLTNTGSM